MGLVCSSCSRNREEKERQKSSNSIQNFLDYIQNNRIQEQQDCNSNWDANNKYCKNKFVQVNDDPKKPQKGLIQSLKKKSLNPKDRVGAIYSISSPTNQLSDFVVNNSIFTKRELLAAMKIALFWKIIMALRVNSYLESNSSDNSQIQQLTPHTKNNQIKMQSSIKNIVEKIPLLTVNQGPRDDQWINRLKEEYIALIKYVEINKQQDNDWFKIESDKEGKKWKGKCWYVHNLIRYEFDVQFEIPATYPAAPIEIELPELDGKTPKMYRGGKICQDIHFAPLWQKNSPKFGIAHALALGLGPWLAAEVPMLIEQGVIKKD